MYPVPANATRLQCIEATGTQWIDTGCTVDMTTKIEARWYQVSFTTEQQRLYGIRENSVYFDLFVKAGSWQGRFFHSTSSVVTSITAGTIYTAVADAAAGTITINGTTASVNKGTGSPSTQYTLPIFARMVDGTPNAGYQAKMRLYYFRIWKSGELVRDFVPVKVNNTGCLFDRVTGQFFYNQGTGNFVCWDGYSVFSHAVKHLSGTGTVLASRVLGNDLSPPYDAQVEYIESSGTQWIDTGFTPNQNTSVKFRFMNLEVTGSSIVGYNLGNDNQDWRFFNYNTGVYMDVWTGRVNSDTGKCNANTWYEFEVGNLYVKDLSTGTNIVSGTAISSFTGTSTIKLSMSNPSATPTKNRFAWVKIYDNGTLVRDLIPVRVGTEYCMYDQANPTGGDNGDGLYHNKGSGSFTGGSDTIIPTVEWSVLFKAIRKHYDMPIQYTVDECNGNAPTAVNVYFPSSKYDALDYTPTWAHHRFVGWYTTSVTPSTTAPTSGTQVQKGDTVVFDHPTIYARWQLPTTVTFDATTNGGQMPPGWVSPDYYEGQPYGTLPNPTKSGEVFLGWFTSGGTRIITSSNVSSGTLTARYMAVTWATTYSCTTTSSYKNTGIYAAIRYSSSDPVVVDWGDGTTDVVYGNISQLAHTYQSAATYTVKISDNISAFYPSYNSSTWYQTTSQNQYTFKKVLTLSSKVTQLSPYAFYYCSAMTDAIIPSGATSIPNYCFYYCSSLKSSTVQLPSTIAGIGQYAFYYCSSSDFNSITIPGGCTSVGAYAFNYCTYLHPLFESGSAILTLNSYSFSRCGYNGSAFTIDLSGRKVTTIGQACFYYCRYLNKFVWPQNVTYISGSAFGYCFYYSASSGTIEIPEGVTSISGTYAFNNCSYLTAVTLPSTLTNLNDYTFRYCTRLTTITCNRTTAPTVSSSTFGNGTGNYVGRTSYSAGTNRLYVPAGATGYDSSYWLSTLCNSTVCGFTLVYVQKRVYDITWQGDTARAEFNFTNKTATVLVPGTGALSDMYVGVNYGDTEWDVCSEGASQGEIAGTLLLVWTYTGDASDFDSYTVVYAANGVTYSEVTS